MNPPIVILRPEPGAGATLKAALAMGLDAYAFPLFETRPRAWDAPAPDTFDALLLGSANVMRHGGADLALYAGKPAYCVGETTAALAVEHGFALAAIGSGGLQDLMGRIAPEHTRLLRLSGEERVELSPPPGVSIEDRVAYASVPLPMPVELARLLCVAALPRFTVLLHSGAAARHFIRECSRLSLMRHKMTAITIGPRVTEICTEAGGWHSVQTAPTPSDAAMLAMAAQTCQNSDGLGGGLDGGLAE